jgi:hypothetical protein
MTPREREQQIRRLLDAAGSLPHEIYLLARVAQLEEALTFYAREDAHSWSVWADSWDSGVSIGPVIEDGGDIARSALTTMPVLAETAE